MDRCNVTAIVNLDGMSGDELRANIERYDQAHPGRFVTFAHLDLGELADPGWPERLAAGLRAAAGAGACGLKVWKSLGLALRDERGAWLMPDDERLAPVFAIAAERRVPILIHAGRGLPPIAADLARLVDEYPEAQLILAHAGIADLGATETEQKVDELVHFVREAGRVPVQRDTLYNPLRRWD
jgi:predicted TIM-barrel fold metal-dependent hydrolase